MGLRNYSSSVLASHIGHTMPPHFPYHSGRCGGHWINIMLDLTLFGGRFLGMPPDPTKTCFMWLQTSTAYIIQALAAYPTKNCFL